jgi:hypothetical protein
VVSFSSLVELIADALLEHEGSARQTLIRCEAKDELEASRQAVYRTGCRCELWQGQLVIKPRENRTEQQRNRSPLEINLDPFR